MLATSRILYINTVQTTATPSEPAQTNNDSIISYATWAKCWWFLHTRKHKEA